MTTWRDDITCWSPEAADHLIPVEAESLPDELFQATHVPLQLRRVDATNPNAAQGERVSEQQVLDQLLRRLEPQSRETDIIPILGASGAGKSHLVRWLRNELRLREDIPDVRFVFVPKHRTSLRGVITAIMSAFEDVAEVAELRDRLLSAREDELADEELRARVRDALANGLEFRPERTQADDEATGQLRTYLAGSLPAILRDPHFGPRYTAPGGAIARLVEEKRRGRRGDDAVEDAFQFRAEDVAISVDDVSHAARAAQEIANQLAADPVMPNGITLSGFAAQMLNDQLPAAIKEVFGIGSEDLRDLFVELRRILRGRQDIMLLVEDFAMFQGLQAGLVDAITLASSVTEELCHLITVVAVTTGYYTSAIPDTLKTRASAAFVVDAQGPDAPAAFAARYLRAMRLRTAKVGDLSGAGPSCDGCPVIEPCHTAFGMVEGEGLFPFNPVLLDRAVQTRLDGEFNARKFLTQVLRPVLVEEHENIRALRHPSEDLAEALSARFFEPAGDALMGLRSRDEGDRRARLALLYKDAVDEGDLSPTVHAAFGLPPLGLAGTTTPCSEINCERQAVNDGRCREHQLVAECSVTGCLKLPVSDGRCVDHQWKLPELVSAIDEWKRGVGIAQRHATRIRQLVTAAVISRVDFQDGAWRASAWDHTTALHPRFDTSRDAKSVVIDGNRYAFSGGVTLELSSEDADTMDAFQALAWLDAGHDWRDVPNGPNRAGRLERLLSTWSATVTEQLRLRSGIDDELVAAGAALEVVAGLAGAGPVPKRRAQRLVRLRGTSLDDDQRWPTAVEAAGGLKNERERLQALLDRRLAYAQGVGAPAAYDLTLTRKLLVAVGEASLDPDGCSRPVKDALKELNKRLRDVDSWGRRLLEDLPDVTALGGEDPKEVITDLDKVARRGQVATETRRAAREAARAVQPEDVALVEQARSSLERWDQLPLAEQAALAGGHWYGAAQRLKHFITSANRVIEAAMPDSVSLSSSDRSQAESEWTAALNEVDAASQQLRKALR